MPRLRLDPTSQSGVSLAAPLANPRTQGHGYVAKDITGMIRAGTNVTLAGNGTTSSPYEISSSGGGSGSGAMSSVLDVSIAPYSATGDGTTNDSPAIQAAIDAAEAAGGGVVYIPEGTYALGAGLTVQASNVVIRGAGFGATTLLLKNAVAATMIAVSGNGVCNVCVTDLTLSGNKVNNASGHGISFNTPYVAADTQHLVQNVDIVSVKQDGIIVSGDTRVIRVFSTRVKQSGSMGYDLGGSDHQITNAIADACETNGFAAYGGNIQFIGCKAFYCDTSEGGFAGFQIEADRTFLTACEAQDNYEHGFVLGAVDNCTLTGCVGDSNGQGAALSGDGLTIWNSSNITVSGGMYIERGANPFPQRYGISLTGTTTGTVIIGDRTAGNATAAYADLSSGTNYRYDAANVMTLSTAQTVTGAKNFRDHVYAGFPAGTNERRFYSYQGPNGTAGQTGYMYADWHNVYIGTTDSGKIIMDGASSEAKAAAIQEAGSPYTTFNWWYDGTSGTGTGAWYALPASTLAINFRLGDAAGVSKVNFKDSGSNTVASINSDGVITGTSFVGDGSALTNLPAGGQTLVTKVVAASGGDYTTLAAALTAASAGWTIYIKDAQTVTANITSALNNIRLVGMNPMVSFLTLSTFTLTLSGTGVQIDNLGWTGTTGHVITGGADARVTNCRGYCTGNGRIIWVQGANSTVSGCYFTMSTGQSFSQTRILFNGGGGSFTNNHIETDAKSTGQAAITVGGDMSTFSANTVRIIECTTGALTINLSGSRATCNGNTIGNEATNRDAVAIYASSIYQVISNNVINRIGTGIQLHSASYHSVTGNAINLGIDPKLGVLLSGTSIGCSLSGNTIHATAIGGVGITIPANCDDNVVVANRIANFTTGVHISAATADRTVVQANALNGNTTAITDTGTGTIKTAAGDANNTV